MHNVICQINLIDTDDRGEQIPAQIFRGEENEMGERLAVPGR